MKFKIGEKVKIKCFHLNVEATIVKRGFIIWIPFMNFYGKNIQVKRRITFLREFRFRRNYIREWYFVIARNGNSIMIDDLDLHTFIEKIDKKEIIEKEKLREELRLKYLSIDPLGEEIWDE